MPCVEVLVMRDDENHATKCVADVETAANDLWHAAVEARRLLGLGHPGEAFDRLARTRDRCCLDGLIDDALLAVKECIG